jgi:hypothetical protein
VNNPQTALPTPGHIEAWTLTCWTNINQILQNMDLILATNIKFVKIHVGNVQGRHFLGTQKPAGMPTTSQGFENANFMGVPKTYKLSGEK